MRSVQLPMFAPPVTLTISFEDLLGKGSVEMDEATRRYRWSRWLRGVRRRERTRFFARAWTDTEGCHEGGRCAHLRGRAWCSLQGLPASVNPVLSFRSGMPGMACMGAGHSNAPAPESLPQTQARKDG